MLTYSEEGDRTGGGVCPRPLPDGSKSILTGIIKKSVTGPTPLWVIGLWTSQAGHRNGGAVLQDHIQIVKDMESISSEDWWEAVRKKDLG